MELTVSGKKYKRQQGVQYLGMVFLPWLRRLDNKVRKLQNIARRAYRPRGMIRSRSGSRPLIVNLHRTLIGNDK